MTGARSHAGAPPSPEAEGVTLARMTLADLPRVIEIDRLSFPIPWSATSYHYELTENKSAYFIVALAPRRAPRAGWLERAIRRPAPREVVGYGGFWFVVDEAHIGTLAVHPDWRGHGTGERLLLALLRRAIDLGAATALLEVRVSNHPAQCLYHKYGFEEVGRRRSYYRDNGEDALLMTVRLTEAVHERVRQQHPAPPP